jgi:hypothetical protein
MQTDNTFLIESELSRHTLLLNGQELATFATLDGAEAEATKLADRVMPGTRLRFELDFKWTLSDLEIRVATLETDSNHQCDHSDRSAVGRSLVCG